MPLDQAPRSLRCPRKYWLSGVPRPCAGLPWRQSCRALCSQSWSAEEAQQPFGERRLAFSRAQKVLNPQPSLPNSIVALNSSDQGVRASAIEVQLAAYGINKTASSVDVLVRQINSSDHAQKVWALWALGLLGNRGVETDRVVQVLTANLRNSGRGPDEDTRRWAVEGLALVGTTPTISPLLQALGNDPSALVRERAACSLSESGMLSHDQRMLAVPQLINYSGDPTLDAQTRAWAFQALADITQRHLPNDPAAWRTWYQNSVASGQ
jgi:hypothetical protein